MTLRRAAVSFLTLAAVGAAGAQAQTTVTIGVLGGAALAKIATSEPENPFTQNKVGFMAGGAVTIGVSPNFAIEPEVLFIQKATKSTKSGFTGTFKIPYVEVPVFAKVRFPGKGGKLSPHFYAGPWMAFKLSCKYDVIQGTDHLTGSCGEGYVAQYNVKGMDMGVSAGAGVDIGRAMIGVRYDLGISKIEHSGSEAQGLKTRALYLLAGFSFPMH